MNNRGFTLVEVICAFSLIMIIATAILPLLTQVRMEQHDLSIKRHAILALNNHLTVLSHDLSIQFPYEIQEDNYSFSFEVQTQYIEGCVNWEDSHNEKNKFCLYASS